MYYVALSVGLAVAGVTFITVTMLLPAFLLIWLMEWLAQWLARRFP